jgi:hypothetical protein
MRKDTRSFEQKKADRDAKLDALHQKLTDSVEAMVTGEDWRRALEFAARFRTHSFRNTLLILVQHAAAHQAGLVPDPSPRFVAGFKQWKHLGRSVMKGQPGYQILAPTTARMATTDPESGPWRRLARGEKPDPGEVVRPRMIGVRVAYVWADSQTEGEDLPEKPQPQLLRGAAPAGLFDGGELVAVPLEIVLLGPPAAPHMKTM